MYRKQSAEVILMEKTTGASGKVLFYSPEVYYAGTNSVTQRVFSDGAVFIIEAVNSENKAISESVTMDSAKSVVLSFGSGLDPLDINQDDKVDVSDVQLCVNYVLSGEYNENADVNDDSKVNVTDVQMVVNKVLGSI